MTLPLTTFKIFAPTLIASRDSDGRMRIEGVGSSTIRDHHGDAFTLKALRKMAQVSHGMTIFMNHEYRVPQDVFGKIEISRLKKSGEIDARTKEEIWDLRLGIIVSRANPEAIKTFELIESDEIKLGISIGAMIPEGGAVLDKTPGGRLLIDDIDPVEFSMVGIPANPRSFVDYAVKAFFGVYPDSKKWDTAHKTLLDQYAEDAGVTSVEELLAQDEAVTAALGDAIEFKAGEVGSVDERQGLEVPEGETGELTVHADGTSEARIVPRQLEAGEVLEEGETPEGSTAVKGEAVEATDLIEAGHGELGDPLEPMLVDGEPHPDVQKQKGDHTHPHAHVHDHEHQHGYEGNQTVHSHPHAHQHSHDHGSDHDHADTMNDYTHNHPHNGSYMDEDHPHEAPAKAKTKAVTDAPLDKTRVTVWEDGDKKTVEVNTGRSKSKTDDDQSAQASLTPDTAGGQDEVVDEGDPGVEAAIAVVAASNTDAAGLLKALSGQLTAIKAENVTLLNEKKALLAIVSRTMQGTAEILRRIGELPAGRKTVEYPQIKADFSDLGDIYDEEVRRLMR